MTNRVSRCKGLKLETFEYSASTKALLTAIIHAMRPQFIKDCGKPELWQGEVLAGPWVNDDGHVMCMLASNVDETTLLKEPLTWVVDAMQACAEHDWLAAEKLADEARAQYRKT